jgi:hypothetical protein
MATVDIFVAAYLVGVIVVLGIFSTLAYLKQVKKGQIKDE